MGLCGYIIKYSPIVRIIPNILYINNPHFINKLYLLLPALCCKCT